MDTDPARQTGDTGGSFVSCQKWPLFSGNGNVPSVPPSRLSLGFTLIKIVIAVDGG
jgi:hypothetical protein